MTFGQRIKTLRTERKISRAAFAEQFGLGKMTVWRVEEANGHIKDEQLIAKIATYFGVTTDWLLGLTESRTLLEREREELIKMGITIARTVLAPTLQLTEHPPIVIKGGTLAPPSMEQPVMQYISHTGD